MKFLIISMACFLMFGCGSDSGNREVITISASSVIDDPTLSNYQKADKLTSQAEELINAGAFAEANEQITLAMSQDSYNQKARLLNSILSPMSLLKGVLTRSKSMASKNPKLLKKYQALINELEIKLPKILMTFLLTGKANPKTDIQSIEQLQTEIDLLQKTLTQSNQTLSSGISNEITLQLGDSLISDMTERYASLCEVTRTGNQDFQLNCPVNRARTAITFNAADYHVLKTAISSLLSLLAVYNSYELTNGFTSVIAGIGDSKFSMQQSMDQLFKNQKFGLLRTEAQIQKIPMMFQNIYYSLQYAMMTGSDLCKANGPSDSNRPGKLFNKGICIPKSIQNNANFFYSMQYGYGSGSTLISEKMGVRYSTNAKYLTLAQSPMKDLRQLGTLKFNKCSQLIEVGDKTAFGMFPAGDANAVLQNQALDCLK